MVNRSTIHRALWRIDGLSAANPALATALRMHLAYHALTTTLVQIGGEQRGYLTLDGCAGCRIGRCVPGCPRDLLARAVAKAMPTCQFTLVPQGLATRQLSRVVLAKPTKTAKLLDGMLLCPWPEARLGVYWPDGKQVRAVALLAVGDDGPEPAAVLRDVGWIPVFWPRKMRYATRSLPATLPRPHSWHSDPFVLFPRGSLTEDTTNDPPDPEGNDVTALGSRLVAQLTPLLTPSAIQEAPAVEHPQMVIVEEASQPSDAVLPSIWPPGPGRMQPSDVGFLIEQIRTSPIVQTGDEAGVTRRRIAQLLPDVLSEYSRQVMCWLTDAGVLAPPLVPEEPFRNPRPLVIADEEALAMMLAATPIPSAEAARAAMLR